MSTHEGKVAVVTGGARGIGQAICAGLAQRGADVVIVDLSDAAETVAAVEKAGRTAVALSGDVADPAAVERIGREITQQMGRCDILVNNAGI